MDVAFPLLLFFFIGVTLILVCSLGLPGPERRTVVKLLIWGFALRMASATAFAVFPEIRVLHADAEGYELIGMRVAETWSGRAPPLPSFLHMVSGRNYGYYYVTAAVYFVTGAFQVSASYFNCIVGIATGLLAYILARKFVNRDIAARALALILFTPSMISWSAVALKDPLVTFFVVLSMYCCVKLKERFSVVAVLGIAGSVAALYPLRYYLVYFVALAVFGSLVLDRGMSSLSGIYKKLFVAALVAALFMALGISSSAQQDAESLDFDQLNRFRQGMAQTANSGFAHDVDISTPGKAIMFLPVAVPTFLLAPFPWQMTSLLPIVAAPETILWWFLFPATIRGLLFLLRQRFSELSPMFIFTIALTGMYSLMQGNVGSAFRMRAQIFVMLFIFTSLGLAIAKARRQGTDPTKLLEATAPTDHAQATAAAPAAVPTMAFARPARATSVAHARDQRRSS